MRKLSLALILAVLILAFAVVPAFADVHGVSQAGCGASGNAGATQSTGKGGRPAAPIPIKAGGASGDGGGDGAGDCDVP